MRSVVSIEPFLKFSNKYLQSKINKVKLNISKGNYILLDIIFILVGEPLNLISLKSRLIQLNEFKPPTLAQLSPLEFHEYCGKKLVLQCIIISRYSYALDSISS